MRCVHQLGQFGDYLRMIHRKIRLLRWIFFQVIKFHALPHAKANGFPALKPYGLTKTLLVSFPIHGGMFHKVTLEEGLLERNAVQAARKVLPTQFQNGGHQIPRREHLF